MDLTGGYAWLALLADGTTIRQYEKEGEEYRENSVDTLKDKAVREIHMLPLNPETHKTIIVDVGEDQGWLKYWVRTGYTRFIEVEEGGQKKLEQLEGTYPAIDALALFPRKGRASRKPVRLFIYPDGSIRLTTDKNP